MKKELDALLCERYPLIFVDRNRSIKESCMGWGFSCGDGWFDLIDTLCERLQFWTDHNKAPQVVAGRACRSIYETALPGIDWEAVSARELAFMRSLGIEGQS